MQTQASKSLRPKQAAEFLGIGLSSLWRKLKDEPTFPRPRKLSERVTYFLESELADWRDSQSARF
ncbi:helix-turn-helix transcriptional regulator [Pseudoxanthomonas sp. 10H]|uniref:helix-turn-helix transcriptional regulator n=1 Tax=Pseudoxanthomonas sp. 10H TaxID=3242729 RepID=UPI0035571DA2